MTFVSVFSLFSVVRFSQSSCFGTNGYNGTCLTSSECKSQSGTSAGTCAAGFGVCCTSKSFESPRWDLPIWLTRCFVLLHEFQVIISTCGTTVSKNATYWMNPPNSALDSSYSVTGRCQLLVNKLNSNICQMRYLNCTQCSSKSNLRHFKCAGWIFSNWSSVGPIRIRDLPPGAWTTSF